MLAQVVRSGVVEACHDGAVAAVDRSGAVVLSRGDVERRYYIRSAAKPFQAEAAIEAGAGFLPEQLAVACASHGGQPIHVAFVRSMLEEVGLDESALQCPPAWPLAESAAFRVRRAGHRRPRRIWHNCSGKHAGMLRACVAAGWPVESYLDPQHPLQHLIRAELSAAVGCELGAAGVDGCGAPVYEVSTLDLARAYAVLAVDARYDVVRSAMQRFGPLTAHSSLLSAPATWWDAAAKGGAEACLGVAARGRFGVGIKSFDGSVRPLGPVTLDVMTSLGVAPPLTRSLYAPAFAAPVRGGGLVVGETASLVSHP